MRAGPHPAPPQCPHFAYDALVLEIAVDDSEHRLLVLMARRPGVLFFLRRVLVTALAIAVPTLVIGAGHAHWDDVLASVGMGAALLLIPRAELREVRVDGYVA